MKKIIIACLVAYSCNQNKNEAQKEYYSTGNLKSISNYNEGKLNDTSFTFYENGIRKSIMIYKNGLKEGNQSTFDENGDLMDYWYEHENQKQGYYVEYYREPEVKITRYENDTMYDIHAIPLSFWNRIEGRRTAFKSGNIDSALVPKLPYNLIRKATRDFVEKEHLDKKKFLGD